MTEAKPVSRQAFDQFGAERGRDCADLLIETGRIVIVDSRKVCESDNGNQK